VPLSCGVIISGKTWRVNWRRVRAARIVLGAIGLLMGGWAFKLIVGMWEGTFPVR
jgi:hypothetical protein